MTPDRSAAAAAERHRCGTAALVGRPNVGKSTLLNALLGWHLSIVGPKPQTTRHKILGILTRPAGQILFVDTPGLHRGGGRALNRRLNRGAREALAQADLAVHLIEAGRWTGEDQLVWEALAAAKLPRLLVLNKIDTRQNKETLLPFLAEVSATHAYDGVYLVSAKSRDGLAELELGIIEHLPPGAAIYADDELTDRSERFLAAELVREQLMLRLAQELPYSTAVEIHEFSDGAARAEIEATIWVEREGQKAIVIGAGGMQLKAIGSAARRKMEKLFERRVHLKLWVKVRENWSDDEAALKRFGYTD
jgi:GTP-binding protein Era